MRPFRLIALLLVVLGFGAYIYFYDQHQPSTDQEKESAGKILPALKQDAVDRITVENSHGRFELAKEGDDWKLVKPLADRANAGAVSSLLSTLSALKAERTLEAGEVKLSDYGLANPKLTVTLHEKTGGEEVLKVGSELPLGKTRGAMTADGTKVLLVNTWVASDLDKGLDDWRSKDLVDVLPDQVAALTVSGGGHEVSLASAGGTWTLTAPIADLADADRASQAIGDLNAAQIKSFDDKPGDLAAIGLAPPKLRVTVVRTEKKPPVQLAFGIERGEGTTREVACQRGDRVVWIDPSSIEKLVPDVAPWRSTRLVKLDTWATDGLTISSGGAKATVERKDGKWLSNGVEVDESAVSERLRAFGDLEVTRFDAPRPAGPPIGTVTAKLQDGSTVEASFFKGAKATEDIATVPGRTGGLVVDAVKVGEVLAQPAALARPKPTPAPTPKGTAVPSAHGTPAPAGTAH